MFNPKLLLFLANFNSTQHQKDVDNKLANLPNSGGDSQWIRFYFKAPAGGLAIADTITFGYIKPGIRFNPAEMRVHWDVGTATCNMDLGHPGFTNEDDAGVRADIAANDDEFLVDADLATATLAGVNCLNARVGSIKVADRNAAGTTKLPLGMLLQGLLNTAGMPANQVVVVEIPIITS